MTASTSPSPIPQPPVQAVIFDLDGVLMDSEWIAFLVWRDYVERHGARLDDSVYPHIIGLTAEETAEYIMRESNTAFDVTESCAAVWAGLSEKLRGMIDPLPGSVELVRDLAGRGLPLAIASNSPRAYIENALRGLGLSETFGVRVGIDMVPQGKPAPDVYLRAAELLGADPARCVAVEDSRVGVQAAAAAGMRVLAIPAHPNGAFHGAWQVFTSMPEAHKALISLLS